MVGGARWGRGGEGDGGLGAVESEAGSAAGLTEGGPFHPLPSQLRVPQPTAHCLPGSVPLEPSLGPPAPTSLLPPNPSGESLSHKCTWPSIFPFPIPVGMDPRSLARADTGLTRQLRE